MLVREILVENLWSFLGLFWNYRHMLNVEKEKFKIISDFRTCDCWDTSTLFLCKEWMGEEWHHWNSWRTGNTLTVIKSSLWCCLISLQKHRWEPKQPRRKPRSNEGRVVPGKENILANFSTTSKVAAATEPDLNKGLIHWFATQSLKSSFSRSRLI